MLFCPRAWFACAGFCATRLDYTTFPRGLRGVFDSLRDSNWLCDSLGANTGFLLVHGRTGQIEVATLTSWADNCIICVDGAGCCV